MVPFCENGLGLGAVGSAQQIQADTGQCWRAT